MKGCQQYTVYLAAERESLRAAIAQNQWSLSRQTGHEVGESLAKRDFLDRFLNAFACQFRLDYCKTCPLGAHCDVRRCADRLNGQGRNLASPQG